MSHVAELAGGKVRTSSAGLLILVLGAAVCSEAVTLPDHDLDTSVARLAGTACVSPILGTAFVVDDELALTVAHAIAGAEEDLRVVTTDGVVHDVSVVGFDPERDLALLSVPGWAGSPLVLQAAAPGDRGGIGAVDGDANVELIPYRIDRIVNARSGDIYDEGAVERTALDLQASVGPGVSGAPLVNWNGEVAGVLFANSRTRDGAAWALDVSEIEEFLAAVDIENEVGRGRCR